MAAIDVTGIMLAKLDGTAKGGVVIAIRKRDQPAGEVHPGWARSTRTSSRSIPTSS